MCVTPTERLAEGRKLTTVQLLVSPVRDRSDLLADFPRNFTYYVVEELLMIGLKSNFVVLVFFSVPRRGRWGGRGSWVCVWLCA